MNNKGEKEMNASKNLLAAVCFVLPFAAFAQTNTPRLDQRQVNQEARIEQGVNSGALTQREAARLENGQQHVENLESKAKADGVVTKQERARLEHAEDVQSRRIYRQKHDRQHDFNHDGRKDRPLRRS